MYADVKKGNTGERPMSPRTENPLWFLEGVAPRRLLFGRAAQAPMPLTNPSIAPWKS